MMSCAARQEMKLSVHRDSNVHDRGDRNCNKVGNYSFVQFDRGFCAMMMMSLK
jgi:hypothetical protein